MGGRGESEDRDHHLVQSELQAEDVLERDETAAAELAADQPWSLRSEVAAGDLPKQQRDRSDHAYREPRSARFVFESVRFVV